MNMQLKIKSVSYRVFRCCLCITILNLFLILKFHSQDHYWKEVQSIATDVLSDYHAHRLKFQQKKPLPLSSRFSFTRSVPRALFERQQSRPVLKDGGSPIVILGKEDQPNGYIATQ